MERAFSVAEARVAREAFVTAASQIVQPVVRIDGTAVGDGRPGPIATASARMQAGRSSISFITYAAEGNCQFGIPLQTDGP